MRRTSGEGRPNLPASPKHTQNRPGTEGFGCGLPIPLSIILFAFTILRSLPSVPEISFEKWVVEEALGDPQFEGLAVTRSCQKDLGSIKTGARKRAGTGNVVTVVIDPAPGTSHPQRYTLRNGTTRWLNTHTMDLP